MMSLIAKNAFIIVPWSLILYYTVCSFIWPNCIKLWPHFEKWKAKLTENYKQLENFTASGPFTSCCETGVPSWPVSIRRVSFASVPCSLEIPCFSKKNTRSQHITSTLHIRHAWWRLCPQVCVVHRTAVLRTWVGSWGGAGHGMHKFRQGLLIGVVRLRHQHFPTASILMSWCTRTLSFWPCPVEHRQELHTLYLLKKVSCPWMQSQTWVEIFEDIHIWLTKGLWISKISVSQTVVEKKIAK